MLRSNFSCSVSPVFSVVSKSFFSTENRGSWISLANLAVNVQVQIEAAHGFHVFLNAFQQFTSVKHDSLSSELGLPDSFAYQVIAELIRVLVQKRLKKPYRLLIYKSS